MRLLSYIVSLLCLAGAGMAAPEQTALTAVKLLPKEAAAELALIEGYDGRPVPERWHLVAYDAKETRGVREYVAAGGELIASRPISQFAETLRPEDVIGAAAVKIDSDRAAKLAQEYARANQMTVSGYHYELKREGEAAVPLWRVACVDAQGTTLGVLVITATRGFVVSHEGFTAEPAGALRPRPEVAELRRPEPRKIPPRPREGEPVPVATPLPLDEENRSGLMRRAGGSLQRILTGRPTPLPQ